MLQANGPKHSQALRRSSTTAADATNRGVAVLEIRGLDMVYMFSGAWHIVDTTHEPCGYCFCALGNMMQCHG